MDVCQRKTDFDSKFLELCSNTSNNICVNLTNILHKDFERYFNKNGFILSVGFISFYLIFFILILTIDNTKIKTSFQGILNVIFSDEIKFSILSKLLSIICLVISLILSPIMLMILSICFTYQTIISLTLKYKFGSRYIGLLDGTDVVWAIEDVSKSVINILAIININNIEEFRTKLSEKMSEIIANPKYAKLKYCYQKKFGYYFWTQNDSFNVEEQINVLPAISPEKTSLNKEELIEILSEYNNKLLPKNHTALWEILIGQQQLETNDNHYPIVFRYHHTVGDGIALLKILLEAPDDKIVEHKLTKQNETMMKSKKFKQSFCQTILSLIFMPAHLIRMNLMRKIDNNILHGNVLSGDKTLAWISENDFPILENVKYIKSQFSGVSFLDVVLAGLSQAFYEYFAQKNNDIPPSITSVVLERADKFFGKEFSENRSISQLQNGFTVGMVTLPILPHSSSNIDNDTGNVHTGCDFAMVERLQEVNRETKMLKYGPDYQINFWLLKMVSKLLPEPILRPLLHSAHSTMVVSNICGPSKVTICDGHMIEDLIFWLPHRGLTGIGVSILSYAGKLQLGISVDKALISNSKEAETILQNFVRSLKMFSNKLEAGSTHDQVL